MMKKIIIALFIIGFWLLVGLVRSVEAAYFQFDPTSSTIKTGETVNIKVNINAGSDELSSADAYVLYDSTYLKVQSVTADFYFPTVTNDTATAGKVYIAGMVDNLDSSSSGSGTLATIVFQALADGEVKLTFDCNNSKIVKNDIDATNILECSQNGQATITIGSGFSSNNNSSSEPTPSVLPKTGVFDNVVKLSVPGALLFFIGVAARLLL